MPARRWTSLAMLTVACSTPSAPTTNPPTERPSPSVPVAASPPPTEPTAPPPSVATAPASERQAPSLEGPRAEIVAGSFLAGSWPGTPFRRAHREADRVEVSVGGFAIDRRPYPNDPRLAPLVVRSQAEAEGLCAERGGRLCTELEWERACTGPDGDVFPGGDAIDLDECGRDPASCASGFGVLGMGLAHPEWTASSLPAESVRMGRSVVVRGGREDQMAPFHRCAARAEVTPTESPLAFRCCYGSASEATYPAPIGTRQFDDRPIELEALRGMMRSVPELAAFAGDFVPYGIAEGDRALARGNVTREALAGWELAPGPFRWSPQAGDETLVFAGRSGEHSLIAVLYVVGDGVRHAASFVFEGEVVPIAIARTPPSREELLWTTCHGCGGESGGIRLGEDGILRIAAR